MTLVNKDFIDKLNREREELIRESKESIRKTEEGFKRQFEESFKLIGDITEWKNRTKEVVNGFIEEEDKVKYAFLMMNTEKEEKLILKGEKIKKDIESLIASTDENVEDYIANLNVEVRNELGGPFLRVKGGEMDVSRVLSEIKPNRISQEENKQKELRKQASFVSIDNSKGNSFLQNNTKRFRSHINVDKEHKEKPQRQGKYTTVTNLKKNGLLSKEVSPNHSFRKIQSTVREKFTPVRITNQDQSYNRSNYRYNAQTIHQTPMNGDISRFDNCISKSPEQMYSTNTGQYKVQKSQTFVRRGMSRNFESVASERQVTSRFNTKATKSRAMQDLLTGKHRKTMRLLLENKLKELDLSFGGGFKRHQKEPFGGCLRTSQRQQRR